MTDQPLKFIAQSGIATNGDIVSETFPNYFVAPNGKTYAHGAQYERGEYGQDDIVHPSIESAAAAAVRCLESAAKARGWTFVRNISGPDSDLARGQPADLDPNCYKCLHDRFQTASGFRVDVPLMAGELKHRLTALHIREWFARVPDRIG